MNIGGELELNSRQLTYAGSSKYNFDQFHTYYCGRSSVKHILQTINKKSFLLPAFLCAAVVQPFKECGVDCYYYTVNNDLSINISHIKQILIKEKIDGIYIINFFGFPQKEEVQFFLEQLKDKYIIIEDCSQGSLIETKHPQVGNIGHFVFTSLRKYLPVPSGALLINNSTYTLKRDIAEDNNFTENRLLAKLLRNYYIRQSSQENTVETIYLDIFRNEELSLNKHIEIAKMALISMQILNNLDFTEIITKRRTNFNLLATFFKLFFENKNYGSLIIDSLPDNISPQYFLMRIKSNRNLVRKMLVNENIYCPILWPYIVGDFNLIYAKTIELSNEILCIPIDQRYTHQDMEFIIEKTTNVLNRIF